MTTLTAATPVPGGGLVAGQPARLSPAPPSGLSGTDIVRIVRQRLVLILLLWGFFCILAAGFTGFMAKYFPKYEAHALIRVKSIQPANVLQPLERSTIRQQEVELLVQNQALIAKSPHVLKEALKDPAIKQTEFYKWTLEWPDEDDSDLLADILSVVPVKDSNFLRIRAIWRYPNEVDDIVNTVVDTYLRRVNEIQHGHIRESGVQLDEEVARAKRLLDGKRKDIERLRSESAIWGAGQVGASEELLTLQALETELGVDLLGRQAQWDQLQHLRPGDLPISAQLQAILQQDPVIVQLERALQDADAQLSLAEARYGKNHPYVKNARLARDAAAELAAEERSVKQLHYNQEQIDQAGRNWQEAQFQHLKLQERVEEAEAEQGDKDAKYATLLRLDEERDLLRVQYEALLEQRNLVQMTLNRREMVQIDVPSRALPPKRRASPKWVVWMPAGALLGLVASLGIALLIEFADQSVRTPRDVTRVPVLGTIPTIDDDEIEIERVETASVDAPHSIVAEAFRTLRANLFFSAPAEQQGVIMVTSPSGGNGKTTIAANLGISIALSGRRVLLIDANFRRAGMARIFPGLREAGLSNILIGQGRLEDLVTKTPIPGLDVLASGPAPPNPSELLGSSYLRDVIVDARSRYDQVIFDGPPVLLVSDALVLAGAVDGVLVVCQYRSTSRGAFQRTQAQLEGINSRVFGAVLNMVETRAGGYFRKVYREFYDYHEPEEEDEENGEDQDRPKLDAGADRDDEVADSMTDAPPPPGAAGGVGAGEAVQGYRGSGDVPGVREGDPKLDLGEVAVVGFDARHPGEASGRSGAESGREGESQPERDSSLAQGVDLDQEIEEMGRDPIPGEEIDLDEAFKIDDDFDLGQDLAGPESPDIDEGPAESDTNADADGQDGGPTR